MQNGDTPAHLASENGHNETLALLLTNKADINAANKVQQFKIFKFVVRQRTSDFKLSFFILSTI